MSTGQLNPLSFCILRIHYLPSWTCFPAANRLSALPAASLGRGNAPKTLHRPPESVLSRMQPRRANVCSHLHMEGPLPLLPIA
jgi:hypothetical protein